MMNQLKISWCFCLILCSFAVQAMNPASLRKETSTYIIDVKYPQGFDEANVNTAIKEYIEYTKKSFFSELSEEENISYDDSSKSGLNITYAVPYQENNTLSVRFNVSVYHRGAAHPLNTVTVLNFIKGSPVKLADLFIPGADYLKPIAAFCSKAITAKKISETKWIQEGTKPVVENYGIWFFTPQGIAIVFNSYQVAAYVYGDQEVAIPLSILSFLIKPEIAQTVWKH